MIVRMGTITPCASGPVANTNPWVRLQVQEGLADPNVPLSATMDGNELAVTGCSDTLRMQSVCSLGIDESSQRERLSEQKAQEDSNPTSGCALLDAAATDSSLIDAVLGILALWELDEPETREVLQAATRLQFAAGGTVVSQVCSAPHERPSQPRCCTCPAEHGLATGNLASAPACPARVGSS